MTSVPVAATAMSLRSGRCFSVSSRSGTLLEMQMSAPFRRSTISDGLVCAYSLYSCGKIGLAQIGVERLAVEKNDFMRHSPDPPNNSSSGAHFHALI